MTRDPELALAARVIREELDRQGIVAHEPPAAARLAVEPVPLGVGAARLRTARRTRTCPRRYAGGTDEAR